jgi:hypothetical protein
MPKAMHFGYLFNNIRQIDASKNWWSIPTYLNQMSDISAFETKLV